MRRTRTNPRSSALAVALALAAPACFLGGSGGTEPPPKADPDLTARVGVVVATNSPSFRRLVDARAEEGAVVLYVQPRGPADGELEAGDVIKEVDGEPAPNAERAVVLLRAREDDRRRLTVVHADGEEDEVTLRAEVPGRVDLARDYSERLDDDPDDPLLRYLRAQTDRPLDGFDDAIEDLDVAIGQEPQFVDAMALRAERRWERARRDPDLDRSQRRREAEAALTDWTDALEIQPENTRALVGLAQAKARLREPEEALRHARRARSLDELFPAAHHAVGIAQFAASRYEDAAESARRAIDLDPFDLRYYELLAGSFEQLDRADDCTATWQAILDLIPSRSEKARLLGTCS